MIQFLEQALSFLTDAVDLFYIYSVTKEFVIVNKPKIRLQKVYTPGLYKLNKIFYNKNAGQEDFTLPQMSMSASENMECKKAYQKVVGAVGPLRAKCHDFFWEAIFMGRRTGTAKWMENQGRWQINVQKDGKRRSFYSSTPGRTGQREANKKADAWLDEGIDPKGTKVKPLYEQFQKESKEIVSTTEYNHIDSIGRVWILPNIGKKRATELNDGDIQKILDKAASMGRSKKTIQDINGTINKFLKWCRRNKKTAYRPEDVQIPASARLKGKTILQPDDLITLFRENTTLDHGQVVKEPWIHAYRMQVLTGLRPGELRGLMKNDVEDGVFFVKRSINISGETTRGKNDNAFRSFALSELAKAELDAQLHEYPSDTEYIFNLPPPSTYLQHWKRFCKFHGMTCTSTYELRHTFVSVAKKLPAGQVKELVGHSQNMDTFGVYGHKLDGEDVETAGKINDIFQKILNPRNKEEN